MRLYLHCTVLDEAYRLLATHTHTNTQLHHAKQTHIPSWTHLCVRPPKHTHTHTHPQRPSHTQSAHLHPVSLQWLCGRRCMCVWESVCVKAALVSWGISLRWFVGCLVSPYWWLLRPINIHLRASGVRDTHTHTHTSCSTSPSPHLFILWTTVWYLSLLVTHIYRNHEL